MTLIWSFWSALYRRSPNRFKCRPGWTQTPAHVPGRTGSVTCRTNAKFATMNPGLKCWAGGEALWFAHRPDLESVRGLIADEGTFRRAVVFESLTTAERRELMVAIEGFGVELGEFTDSDRKANTFPSPSRT